MTEERGALQGISVLELALSDSDVAAGMATSLPGMFFADHGASVIRVTSSPPQPLASTAAGYRVWNRGKRSLPLDLGSGDDLTILRRLLDAADVCIAAGLEASIEEGLDRKSLSGSNPTLIWVQIDPSRTDREDGIADHDILVQAASGLMSVCSGDAGLPTFCAVPLPSFGTALGVITGVLAALIERETTGRGQLLTTSLYDGLSAVLTTVLRRAERPTFPTGGPSMTWLYECADGRWIHLNLFGKGVYGRLLSVFGDTETPERDIIAALQASPEEQFKREERWQRTFRSRAHDEWLRELWAADVPAQPVLSPGEALQDEHVRAVGLSITQPDASGSDILAMGPPVQVNGYKAAPVSKPDLSPDEAARSLELVKSQPRRASKTKSSSERRLLESVKVLDFGSYVAGPLGCRLLADLGADVIKVEALTGDPMRSLPDLFFSCQRGKRSLAMDPSAPGADDLLRRLFRWADVVHHNLRPGVPERLGIDRATAHAANPNLTYCSSPAFGDHGPKAQQGGFDQLFQAFCGIESAIAGQDSPPEWHPSFFCDVGAGWLSAISVLLGRLVQLRTGQGQSVECTLLAAGLFALSGVFVDGDETVLGPEIDRRRTGYGPGYRIYEGSDGRWTALAVPDEQSWTRLFTLIDPGTAMPFVPLRIMGEDAAKTAERTLEEFFLRHRAEDAASLLRKADIPCTVVVCDTSELSPRSYDFATLHDAFFDDALNRKLGRVNLHSDETLGEVEESSLPLRFEGGSLLRPSAAPKVGEHTREILSEIGFDAASIARLEEAGLVSA